MVASSSNFLLVASSTHGGHVQHTGSTIPNDHDLTSESENRRGYMIRSTSTNNISGISGTNLKDMIMLQTVAPMAFTSTVSASTSVSVTPNSAAPAYASATSTDSITPPFVAKEEGKQSSRPRPRRKKMVSIGVDAMKKMIVTTSSVVVALPESPTLVSRKHEREGEQRDDIDSVFNNIRSTSTARTILAFDLSAPIMPDMSMPALPTPATNQRSKQKNEMSNNDNDNTASMKKKKKKNHMGRRLRQIKRRLTLTSTSKSTTSSSKQEEEVCLSPGTTSATTSTSSFGQTSQEEEDDTDTPIFDRMTTNMTTTLKPRVRSLFPDEEEDRMMMPMMPVLPAPSCPLSSTDEEVTTPSAHFSSKLDKALSVLSPNDGDGDDDGNAVADDTADDWGVFASYDDDEEEEEDDSDDQTHNYNYKSKPFSRSSFTKNTSNPCFQPRAHLPVFAATAGAE